MTNAEVVVIEHPLSLSAIWSVTISVFVFAVVFARALSPGAPWRLLTPLSGVFAVAATFTFVEPLRALIPKAFPFVMLAVFSVAIGSLLSTRARAAFDAISDRDARVMLSFRAIFGAFLFALAAIGHMPHVFALTAGLGDLVVGWLALVAPPGTLARGSEGSRRWALGVHAVGLLDLIQVLWLAATLVLPWSIERGNVASAMALPWVAVPLMFGLNAHGIRSALQAESEQIAQPGLEPARRV